MRLKQKLTAILPPEEILDRPIDLVARPADTGRCGFAGDRRWFVPEFDSLRDEGRGRRHPRLASGGDPLLQPCVGIGKE